MQNGRSPFNTTSPYASLRDMFDGGGLLSFLANAFASPMGSQQGMQATPPAMPQPMPQVTPADSAAPVTAAPPPVTMSTLPRQEFDFLTMMQAMAAQRQQQAGASFAPFAANRALSIPPPAPGPRMPQQFPRWY